MSVATAKGSIKAILHGRGLVTLRPSDHLATGGEGSIYRIGSDTVAKIYSDPGVMSRTGMAAKIRLLSRIKSPYVVAPTDIILSEAQEPIGYYMPYAEGHPLARVFTTEFWNREGFDRDKAQKLVGRMREAVDLAHQSKAVMVDANELNWLMRYMGSEPQPSVVDVDSWAIGKWPAKVIMPSIRDWHATAFDEKSDWFSWGIVTFQVFTGIHPYKGTHPSFKKAEFIERMKANASVFSPNVRVNQAVRDFSLIPKGLREWYEATFEKGERTHPPAAFDIAALPGPAVTMKARAAGDSKLLVFDKLYSKSGDPVIRVFSSGAALLASGILIDVGKQREIAKDVSSECEVAESKEGWLILERKDGRASLRYSQRGSGKGEQLPFSMESKAILGQGNRIFTLGSKGLTEIRLHDFGDKVVASPGHSWGTLPNSTSLFDGLGVQDAMGAMFLVVPVGDSGLVQVRARELDGLRVIGGKAGGRFASVMAIGKSGSYQRIDFSFSADHSSYAAEVTAVDQPELNLAILPKGVNASIPEDGDLLVTVPSNGKATSVRDKHISTGMQLSNIGDQVVYIENGAVWALRMK
jgi:hypothetical protein